MDTTFKIQLKTKVRMHQRDFQSMQAIKPGSTLFCDTGVLWVTQVGDRRDYVLLPGQNMTVTKRGKVVVEAMRDADFHVV
jgi:Protein of unknown function (DUF2917)